MGPRAADSTPDKSLGQLMEEGMRVSAGASSSKRSRRREGDCPLTPDGRACVLCQHKGSETDPVFNENHWKWAYPYNTSTGKNEGMLCLYCFKTFRTRFKHKFSTLEALRKKFGEDCADAADLQVLAEHVRRGHAEREVL